MKQYIPYIIILGIGLMLGIAHYLIKCYESDENE